MRNLGQALFLTLAALGFGQSADTADYVPPRAIGGQIVPGHIEPAPAPRP